jgi:uncharacterized damage-inducible protein DinB
MLARHLAAEAYNNAWANHRLLDACGQLTDDEFAATRTSFFPSIRATLNHILTVDWYYLEALERSRDGLPPHGDARRHFAVAEPFATCAPLAAAQREADRRLIAFCESLDDATVEGEVLIPRAQGVARDSFRRILAHLFQHQIHHRGQAHAMLAGTNVKPPPLDEFYCANEAHLRAKEFGALGFSEEKIWALERPR